VYTSESGFVEETGPMGTLILEKRKT
jgi:hypothetical protein